MKHVTTSISRNFVRLAALAIMLLPLHLSAQQIEEERDPCGHDLLKAGAAAASLVWGYQRDALVTDLQRWAVHPWVSVDVIGQSVRGAPLFHVVLTNPSSTVKKKRIWIHARTHPIESESSWVARAIMDELLSGSALSVAVLDNCIVHVLPMLNPDGVELAYARENANGIDIESNWNAVVPQPEVQALRSHLEKLMQTSSPIEVALNLHSAYQCRRYFVYHDPFGTSELFGSLERRFIDFARARFPNGIEPYDYFVTWTSGTPDRYPESWFWMNFRESVMALTYEDMNCATAGSFDRTARALLGGAADYMGVFGPLNAGVDAATASTPEIISVYPQPLNAFAQQQFNVLVRLPERSAHVRVEVLDVLGRVVARLWDGDMSGSHTLSGSGGDFNAGLHFIRMSIGDDVRLKAFQVIR